MLETQTIKAVTIKTFPLDQVESSQSPDVIEPYLSDEAGALKGEASRLFYPVDEFQAAAVIRWGNETDTPVTISGGGTGITGSRVPQGGAVLAAERMINVRLIPDMEDRLIKQKTVTGQVSLYLDEKSGIVILPGGLSLGDLMEIITPRGLIYPPNPTEWTSMVGGNVSTNASGGRSFKFGAIRNWVRRLRVILPTGDLLEVERGHHFADSNGNFSIEYPGGVMKKVPIPGYQMPGVKNASGLYSKPGMDLIDLFIGCEGLLGFISEVELELVKTKGQDIFGCIVFFEQESDAVAFVVEARDKSRDPKSILDTMTIDYFDSHSLDFMRKTSDEIPGDARAAVFVEQMVPDDPEPVMMAWMELFEEHNVSEDWSAVEARDRERLRNFRHSLPENVNETMRQRG